MKPALVIVIQVRKHQYQHISVIVGSSVISEGLQILCVVLAIKLGVAIFHVYCSTSQASP